MAWIDKLVGRSPIGPMQEHMSASVTCARQIIPLVEAMAAGLAMHDGTTCLPATMTLEAGTPGGAWDEAGPAGMMRRAEAALRQTTGHKAALRVVGERARKLAAHRSQGAEDDDTPQGACLDPRDTSQLPCVRLVLHEGHFHQVNRTHAHVHMYVHAHMHVHVHVHAHPHPRPQPSPSP